MKKFLGLNGAGCLLVAGIFAAAASAQADGDGFYGQLGYIDVHYNATGYAAPYDYNGQLAAIVLGYNFNQHVALEGLYATNVGVSDSVYAAQLSRLDGIFVKGTLRASRVISFYGKLGLTGGSFNPGQPDPMLELDGVPVLPGPSGTGVGYGLGVQADLSEQLYLTFDYMNYYNKSPITLGGPGLSVGYRF